MHEGDVPIIGGMAMFAGIFSAMAIVPMDIYPFGPLFLASAILVIVGVVDDRFHLSPPIRMSAQVAVVLITYYGADLSLASIGDPFGTGELLLGPGIVSIDDARRNDCYQRVQPW